MFKRYFFVMLCGILVISSNGYARTYSKENAIHTLTMGLVAHLDLKTDLKNAVVIDFVNLDGKTTMLGRYIAEDLSTKLAKSADFKIIERRYVNKVITEQGYSLSDFVEPTNAASLGKLVRAQGIVIGTITELKNAFQINARIIQTKTSEVLSTYEIKMKKDIDTMKLASHVITPKVKKKKIIKKVAPKPEAKQEPKKERSIVKEKPKSKEKIFYYEDFSEVKDGDLPKGWYGGENLMVKTIERGKKVLLPFRNTNKYGSHKAVIENIKLPEDWKFEWVIYCSKGKWWKCKIGNLEFKTNPSGHDRIILDGIKKKTGDEGISGKVVKVDIFKKSNKFYVEIDGEQKIFIRKNDFKKSGSIPFEIDIHRNDFKLYSIKGTDLTQKPEEK